MVVMSTLKNFIKILENLKNQIEKLMYQMLGPLKLVLNLNLLKIKLWLTS